MNMAVDNAFYVFDEEGKYLYFHKCLVTNLYRLNIQESEDEGWILTMVFDKTDKHNTMENNKVGYFSLDCNCADKVRYP